MGSVGAGNRNGAVGESSVASKTVESYKSIRDSLYNQGINTGAYSSPEDLQKVANKLSDSLNVMKEGDTIRMETTIDGEMRWDFKKSGNGFSVTRQSRTRDGWNTYNEGNWTAKQVKAQIKGDGGGVGLTIFEKGSPYGSYYWELGRRYR